VITADQLLCHAIGDYVLQSDWMANEKTKRSLAALAHVATYALPFLFLRPSMVAIAVIVGTHFVIDRWRLARFVCWAKNIALCPPSYEHQRGIAGPMFKWSNCRGTGYPSERPPWLAVWLLIIADNVMHVLINGAALRYL
jgi:hypothetical protein